MLMTLEEIKAMINSAENDRDRTLVSVLFEGALRPGELLSMTVGSVEFKDSYIQNLYVAPNHRRLGVGSKLLRKLLKEPILPPQSNYIIIV
jgi:ribosomal protein S18 acetylase RimI-like enzyme